MLLNKFRQISTSMVMKVFLGILALTFILWGIGTKTGHRDYVAKVGNIYIDKADFLRTKKYFLRMVGQAQDKLEPDALNKVVLESLIKDALIKSETEHLGLIVGEEVVSAEIAKRPEFKNKEGVFDKTLFKQLLAAHYFTEGEFIDRIKQDVSAQILDSIFVPYEVSEEIVKEYHSAQGQERRIDLITVNQPANAPSYQVTDAEISDYYAHNKDKFASPEKRDFSYAVISADTYQSAVKVSDKEVEESFSHSNQNKATITEAMRKEAKESLLAYKVAKYTQEQIKKIEDALAAGDSFKIIAEKYGLAIKAVKSMASDAVHADTPEFITQNLSKVFALKENKPETLSTDEQKEGYYIVNVNKIYPSEQRTLEESTKAITEALIEAKQRRDLNQAALKLYNDLTEGKRTVRQVLDANANVEFQNITIAKTNDQLNANLVANIFEIRKKNGHTNLYPAINKLAFQFAFIKSIVSPKDLPQEKLSTLQKQLSSYLTNSIQHEMLNHLAQKYGVKVFPSAFKEEGN